MSHLRVIALLAICSVALAGCQGGGAGSVPTSASSVTTQAVQLAGPTSISLQGSPSPLASPSPSPAPSAPPVPCPGLTCLFLGTVGTTPVIGIGRSDGGSVDVTITGTGSVEFEGFPLLYPPNTLVCAQLIPEITSPTTVTTSPAQGGAYFQYLYTSSQQCDQDALRRGWGHGDPVIPNNVPGPGRG